MGFVGTVVGKKYPSFGTPQESQNDPDYDRFPESNPIADVFFMGTLARSKRGGFHESTPRGGFHEPTWSARSGHLETFLEQKY